MRCYRADRGVIHAQRSDVRRLCLSNPIAVQTLYSITRRPATIWGGNQFSVFVHATCAIFKLLLRRYEDDSDRARAIFQTWARRMIVLAARAAEGPPRRGHLIARWDAR